VKRLENPSVSEGGSGGPEKGKIPNEPIRPVFQCHLSPCFHKDTAFPRLPGTNPIRPRGSPDPLLANESADGASAADPGQGASQF
jgi:hypothetical protein